MAVSENEPRVLTFFGSEMDAVKFSEALDDLLAVSFDEGYETAIRDIQENGLAAVVSQM